jgi:hypothetical protein
MPVDPIRQDEPWTDATGINVFFGGIVYIMMHFLAGWGYLINIHRIPLGLEHSQNSLVHSNNHFEPFKAWLYAYRTTNRKVVTLRWNTGGV